MSINHEQRQDTISPRYNTEPRSADSGQCHPLNSEPNAGTGDPADGRERYCWRTGYEKEARKEILYESVYLFIIFISSFTSIFVSWSGWIGTRLTLTPEEATTIKKYLLFAGSGMLGGVVFGIKYFYRVVARGFWHQDRRIWRILSPWLAMSIAFVVGALTQASFISINHQMSGAAIVSIGFLSGYFADDAVAKLYEIASVIFGRSSFTKAGDGK